MTDITDALRYDWALVECPKCHSPRAMRCRSLKTRRTTDSHKDRILAGARRAREQRLAEGDR